ncbi:MAG: hypothetical protein AAB815_02490 [Patescibacteria group bacterium]
MKKLLIIFLFLVLIPSPAYAARLWTTGFELQWLSNNGEMEEQCSGTPFSMDTTRERSGAGALKFLRSTAGTGLCGKRGIGGTGQTYFRTYLNIETSASAQTAVLFVEDNNGADVAGIDLDTNDTLQMTYLSGGVWTDTGSPSSALSKDTWYRLEFFADCTSATTIDIEARLDGSTIATGTGLTATCASSSLLRATIGSRASITGEWYFDDVAVNSAAGTAQTSWPGEGKVVNLFPDGNAGDNNNASSGDCTSVDEVTPDGATTIAVLDANSDILDCNVEDPTTKIAAADTITLVQVGYTEAAASAASGSLAARVKSAASGTTSTGSTKTHDDTTYRWPIGDPATDRPFSLTSYTDPTTTVAWTVTGTNSLANMQVGVTAIDADPDMNITSISAVVEYVLATPSSGNRNFFFFFPFF